MPIIVAATLVGTNNAMACFYVISGGLKSFEGNAINVGCSILRRVKTAAKNKSKIGQTTLKVKVGRNIDDTSSVLNRL